MANYWRRAAARAFNETLAFFGFTRRSRLVFSVTVISYFLALLFVRLLGGTQQMNEELQWIVAIIGAGLAVFVPVYLVNLVAAPARMDREWEEKDAGWAKEKRDLQAKVERKLDIKRIQEEYAKLFREGQAVMRRVIKGPELTKDEWETIVRDWQTEVTTFLEEHTTPATAATWDSGAESTTDLLNFEGAQYSGDRGAAGKRMQRLLYDLDRTRFQLPTH